MTDNNEFKLNTIDEAIEQFRKGEFVIVVDDEDRENEGDFIIAAECITEEKVNFMMSEGRGVLCTPVTTERCKQLGLTSPLHSAKAYSSDRRRYRVHLHSSVRTYP